MMFNDWQIVHFHLGRFFESPKKIRRSGPLLFAYVSASKAIFLDVLPHGAWGVSDLVRILRRIEPAAVPKLNGLNQTKDFSDSERLRLRQAGVLTALTIDGELYAPPGFGVVTSGHALRIVRYAEYLRRAVGQVLEQAEHGGFPAPNARAIYANVALPIRLGISMFAGEFMVHDKNRGLSLMHVSCIA